MQKTNCYNDRHLILCLCVTSVTQSACGDPDVGDVIAQCPVPFHSEIQQCGRCMDKQKIMIVDHEPLVISMLVEFLKDEPYEIFTAENGLKSLEILRQEKIDLAVVEAHVEDMDGITLLEHVKAEKIQTAMLIHDEFGICRIG